MKEKIYFAMAGGVVFAFCFAVVTDAVSASYEVNPAFYGLMGILFGGSTVKGFIETSRKKDEADYDDRPDWDY